MIFILLRLLVGEERPEEHGHHVGRREVEHVRPRPHDHTVGADRGPEHARDDRADETAEVDHHVEGGETDRSLLVITASNTGHGSGDDGLEHASTEGRKREETEERVVAVGQAHGVVAQGQHSERGEQDLLVADLVSDGSGEERHQVHDEGYHAQDLPLLCVGQTKRTLVGRSGQIEDDEREEPIPGTSLEDLRHDGRPEGATKLQLKESFLFHSLLLPST